MTNFSPRLPGSNSTADGPELPALILRVMAQDGAALMALCGRLSSQVYGIAMRLTRCLPPAKEVLQYICRQVWRQASRFDPARGSAKAWVIVTSAALSDLRTPNVPRTFRADLRLRPDQGRDKAQTR